MHHHHRHHHHHHLHHQPCIISTTIISPPWNTFITCTITTRHLLEHASHAYIAAAPPPFPAADALAEDARVRRLTAVVLPPVAIETNIVAACCCDRFSCRR
jgi:hypothetical protein